MKNVKRKSQTLKCLLAVGIALGFNLYSYASVYLSEGQSCNETTYVLSDGSSSDWIEISNSGILPVELDSYYLSDDSDDLLKWPIPSYQIGQGEQFIIMASGDDGIYNGVFHANFKINSNGETIYLTSSFGSVDSLEVNALCDYSSGKINGEKYIFAQPSPGLPNSILDAEPVVHFSHLPGFYKDSLTLELSTLDGFDIYYTLDGSEPTISSNLYSGPLSLDNRAGDPNYFSTIPTAVDPKWYLPAEEVFKINVIRAKSFQQGEEASRVYTSSYIIDEEAVNRYNVPVISMNVNAEDFWSDSIGIYVPGDKFIYSGGSYGNYHMDWERAVSIEYFDEDGHFEFQQDAGCEIAGQTTRTLRQKGIKLKAKSSYGRKKFKYDFFETGMKEFENVRLNAAMKNVTDNMAVESMICNMSTELNILQQDARMAVLFINGEYWGIHTLIETVDKHFLNAHYDIDKDSIDMLIDNNFYSTIVEGNRDEYMALRAFITDNDMSNPNNYLYATTQMNMESFIDYIIFELYMANDDWPGNNFYMWRPKDHSRKWEWLPYDYDFCYDSPWSNVLPDALESSQPTNEYTVILFTQLLTNDLFFNQFSTRVQELFDTDFCYDNTAFHIAHNANLTFPIYEEHISRWNYEADPNDPNAEDVPYWIDFYFWFAWERPIYLANALDELLDITVYPCIPDTVDVTINEDLLVCNSSIEIQGETFTEDTVLAVSHLDELNNDSLIIYTIEFVDIDNSIDQNGEELIALQEDVEYQWYICSGMGLTALENETNQSFVPSENGQYALGLSHLGCETISDCISYSMTGISSFEQAAINILPNPSSDYFSIQTNDSNTLPAEICLLDLNGRVLRNYTGYHSGERLSVLDLENGVYFVKVSFQSGEKRTMRFIKQ